MRIAVYGATGQAGTEIVAEAARRGHEIIALSRTEPTAPLPEHAAWQHGDVADSSAVAVIAAAADVVVSAIGPSREPGGDPGAFTGTLTAFAAAVAPTRLVIVGGAGSLLAAPGTRLVDTPEFPDAYKPEALAHADALEAVRAGDESLDWTYLSPAPGIGPGARTGSYRVGGDYPVGGYISFADFAIAVVDEIEQPAHRRERFTVASD